MFWMRVWIVIALVNFISIFVDFDRGDTGWAWATVVTFLVSVWMFFYSRRVFDNDNKDK